MFEQTAYGSAVSIPCGIPGLLPFINPSSQGYLNVHSRQEDHLIEFKDYTELLGWGVESQDFIADIKSFGIAIPNLEDVNAYLKQCPDLRTGLLTACKSVRPLMDSNTKVTLEVYHDPEIEDCYLTIYVRQFYYDQKLMDKLDLLSQQFESELAKSSGWLILTTDFQLPR